jgi:hypothetical protein
MMPRDVPPYRPSSAPKWDTLERDRRPQDRQPQADGMAFQYRPSYPREFIESVVLLLLWALGAVPLVYMARLAGGLLTHPVLQPLWVIGIVGAGLYALLSRKRALIAGLWAFAGIVLFFFLSVTARSTGISATEAPAISGLTHLFLLAFALGGLAVLVDCIATHTIAWMLVSPVVTPEERSIRLAWWEKRFHPDELQQEAETLRARGQKAEAEDVTEIAHYHRGFLVLVLYALLPLLPNALPLLLLLPPLVAIIWVIRDAPTSPWRVRFAVTDAIQTWMHYGLRGEDAAGVFRSPIGGRLERLAFTGGTVVFLTAALVPTPSWETLAQAFSGYVPAAWRLIFTLIGSVLLPLSALGTLTLAALGRLLPRFDLLLNRPLSVAKPKEGAAPHEKSAESASTVDGSQAGNTPAGGSPAGSNSADSSRTEWDVYVERIQNSSHPIERRQLFAGWHATEEYPIYLPLKSFREHAHLMGATGSGKTSRGVGPFIVQLLRHTDPVSPLVVIDMKGELPMFQTVKLEAERAGRTFKYFTNAPNHSTHIFNPFYELQQSPITLNQVCELILAALNLEHGAGYGRSYYSVVARNWLTNTLYRRPQLASFAELFDLANDPIWFRTADERRDAFELIANIEILAKHGALNLVPTAGTSHPSSNQALIEHAIHMPTVVEKNEVVYFYLSAGQEMATTRILAGLALYCLYTVCIGRSDSKPTYLFVDEFQRVASRNFEVILQQSRSKGLSLILANQSINNLKTDDIDLTDTVAENTNYWLFFTARGLTTRKYIGELSGETIYQTINEQFRPGFFSDTKEHYTTTEQMGPRLQANDIIRISANEELAFCVQPTERDFSRFGGHLFVARCPHYISEDVFDVRSALPWPVDLPGTITLPVRPPFTENSPAGGTHAGSTPSRGNSEHKPAHRRCAQPDPGKPPAPPPPTPKEGTAWASRFDTLPEEEED